MKKRLTYYVIVMFIAVLLMPLSVVVNNLANAKEQYHSNEETLNFSSDTHFAQFETDLSIGEYEKYCFDNNITPKNTNVQSEVMTRYFEVRSYLRNNYPEYNWDNKPTNTKFLKDRYGENPEETSQNADYMLEAKRQVGLENSQLKKNVGCGVAAMSSVFNYFAETLNYFTFNSYTKNNVNDESFIYKNRVNRAVMIMENTNTTGGGNLGTSMLPLSFKLGAVDILKQLHLIAADDNRSSIQVQADTVPRAESLLEKKATLKNAIDDGLIPIWWTGDGFGHYSKHYMNVIGYEEWVGTDNNGNTHTHTFFEINPNWNESLPHIIDSDMLQGSTMGFIFFRILHLNINVDNSALEIGSSYNSTEISKMTPTLSRVDYLRAAYINHYSDAAGTNLDGQYVALSPKKKNEGTAYLQMYFSTYVVGMHIDVSWWREKDRYTDSQGELKIQYRDMDTEEWVTICDLLNDFSLSTDLSKPTRLYVTMPFVSNVIRFYAKYNTPTGNSNGGRFILHGLNVFLAF